MTCLLPLTRALLRSRIRELAVYLRFLRVALEKDAFISARKGQVQFPLDKELTHMMKANVCLLLYSAMEASMVQLLDEMHDTIGQNCKGADHLNSKLISTVTRHFKSSKTDLKNMSTPLHESLFNIWLHDWQNRDQREKREAGLSGSVDSLLIFQRLSGFGVFTEDEKKPPTHLTHVALQNTKRRRNELAHGEHSFVDLGQRLAFEELCKDARAVFVILMRVTREVNGFLQQRRYLAAPNLVSTEA